MPLLLHRDGLTIKRQDLAELQFPQPDAKPVTLTHYSVLEMIERGLEKCGLNIVSETHELRNLGNRYFGLIEIRNEDEKCGASWVVGVRNSYDQSFSPAVLAGARERISENLSFSGEVKLECAQNPASQLDLGENMPGIIKLLHKFWLRNEQRISSYRSYGMNDVAAHDLIIRALDAGACPNRLIPAVLAHWRVPCHDPFQARTAWSLFNAFTEAFKGNLFELPIRTERLYPLFDARVGIKKYPKGQDAG